MERGPRHRVDRAGVRENLMNFFCVETLKKNFVSTEEGSGGPRHRVDHAGV